jgi:hypothetical protein
VIHYMYVACLVLFYVRTDLGTVVYTNSYFDQIKIKVKIILMWQVTNSKFGSLLPANIPSTTL